MATKKKKREKVVITGICGALGKLLALHLHKDFDVIGVDRRPFYDRPKDINHLRLDLRRKSAISRLKKEKPDTIKGEFIKNIFITSTMGISYKIGAK